MTRLRWFDVLRGIAITSVVGLHFTADVGGLRPQDLDLFAGAWTPAGMARLFTTQGYMAVHVFIVASGAGLVLAGRHRLLPPAEFYRRRLARILVPYLLAIPVAVAGLAGLAAVRSAVSGRGWLDEWSHGSLLAQAPWEPTAERFAAALLLVPRLFSHALSLALPPSAWFLVLLLQLYLLFPWLDSLRRRLPAWVFLLAMLAVEIAAREAAWNLLPEVQRGHFLNVLGPCRVFELALGMVVGSHLARIKPAHFLLLVPPAAALWVLATIGEPTRWRTVTGPLVALSLTILLVPIAAGIAAAPGLGVGFAWVGRRSLEVVLVNDIVRFALGSWITTGHGVEPVWLSGTVFLTAVAAATWAFARLSDPLTAAVQHRASWLGRRLR